MGSPEKGETRSLKWTGESLLVLDQRRLPFEVTYAECRSPVEVARAIADMLVRGAPAIGAAAAYGMALGGLEYKGSDPRGLMVHLEGAASTLIAARPTAVNLAWAVERLLAVAKSHLPGSVGDIKAALIAEADAVAREDVEANRRIGDLGAALFPRESSVLTYCNAGALATVDYGTALGVIRSASSRGLVRGVYVCETRPYLQGARLTAFELMNDGIPVTLITDNAAGYVMRKGLVDLVVVGADRIARNGDVANKIGTYMLAVLARENGIPFYVAAPISTVDMKAPSGADIPIEERSPEEVTHIGGVRVAPEGVQVTNPAFDVTPHELISAIITDRGIVREPYQGAFEELFGSSEIMPTARR